MNRPLRRTILHQRAAMMRSDHREETTPSNKMTSFGRRKLFLKHSLVEADETNAVTIVSHHRQPFADPAAKSRVWPRITGETTCTGSFLASAGPTIAETSPLLGWSGGHCSDSDAQTTSRKNGCVCTSMRYYRRTNAQNVRTLTSSAPPEPIRDVGSNVCPNRSSERSHHRLCTYK